MTRAAGALLSVFILASASAPAQSNGIPLTVERIFAHEHMTGAPPEGLTWSPDGKHLTYLDGGELIDLDPGTGRPHVLVSRAKLAALSGVFESEQDRDHRERYKMASYIWAPDSKHLLFDSGGRLWLYNLGNGTGVQIGFTDTLVRRRSEILAQQREHQLYPQSWAQRGSPGGDRGRRAVSVSAPAQRGHLERRSRLGVRGRAGRAQQLFLVARLEERRVSADG